MSKLLREDKSHKPDFTYIGELYPSIVRVVDRFTHGEKKYARLNWRHCKDNQTYKQSLARHLQQYLAGHTDEDHLSAVVVNSLILMDLEDQPWNHSTK